MPSISDSRKHVQETLRSEGIAGVDHDAVLAGLRDEIDKHNSVKADALRFMRESKREEDDRSQHRSHRSTRFRFKQKAEDSRHRRKHGSRRHDDDDEKEARHRKKRKHERTTPSQTEEAEITHPFPREPTDPTKPDNSTDDAAFRDSLFDALADDEGAAYWESVYSQPIHVYERPSVQTEKGELEQMTDEEYTAYVKTKMWEKKHPEIVVERERTERRRREEEEEKVRRREEFVRRKEQAAWERVQRAPPGQDSEDDSDVVEGRRYKYKFAGEKEWDSSAPSSNRGAREDRIQREEYTEAWSGYLIAWEKLKLELLQERQDGNTDRGPTSKPSKRIPWPVLASKPVIKANIEDFMCHAPADNEHPLVQVLKTERVRWHPDKIQQRFGGDVDEGTMKIVTGVFQVVDGLLEDQRKRPG